MALAFVALATTKADAAFIAYICNDVNCLGGGDVIITDNGVGDLSALSGRINTGDQSVGGFTVVNPNAVKSCACGQSFDTTFGGGAAKPCH